MSPRKSSTSSARPTERPRYLGIEAAGEPVPRLSPRGWEASLRAAWTVRTPGAPAPRFRLVRSEGSRAIVEIDHRSTAAARAAWNGSGPDRAGITFRTARTWGTLVGAKRWIRSASERPPAAPVELH